MRLPIFLAVLLFLLSCEEKDTGFHTDRLSLSGNTTDAFSNRGEEREFIIQFSSEPSISVAEAETLLKSSDITFTTQKNIFTFSDIRISGHSIIFKVSCKENETGNKVEDEIRIGVMNNRFNLEVTEGLTQDQSLLTYTYKIEPAMASPFTIPAEGGIYTIPIKSKRQTYINDVYRSEEPYSLNGIRYVSGIANIAWGMGMIYIKGKKWAII